MAKCPLCARRAAKRSCPAKGVRICSVCCGTKREVEIDCPSDCAYLQQGRLHGTDRAAHPAPPSVDLARFGQQFFQRHAALVAVLAQAVLEERRGASDLVDQDALDAFDALGATMKTLSAGIYYETVPATGRGAVGLYRRLKALLDGLMQPGQMQGAALRVSDALEVFDFMRAMVGLHSSGRPRSRRYLDWLGVVAPEAPEAEAPRLILP